MQVVPFSIASFAGIEPVEMGGQIIGLYAAHRTGVHHRKVDDNRGLLSTSIIFAPEAKAALPLMRQANWTAVAVVFDIPPEMAAKATTTQRITRDAKAHAKDLGVSIAEAHRITIVPAAAPLYSTRPVKTKAGLEYKVARPAGKSAIHTATNQMVAVVKLDALEAAFAVADADVIEVEAVVNAVPPAAPAVAEEVEVPVEGI